MHEAAHKSCPYTLLAHGRQGYPSSLITHASAAAAAAVAGASCSATQRYKAAKGCRGPHNADEIAAAVSSSQAGTAAAIAIQIM